MKRIIFFSKNLNIGGMEKALVSLLNCLVLEYDVTLVLEEKKGVLLSDLNSQIKVEEYKLSNSKNVILRKAQNYLKRTIWAFKNKKRYDFSCNYATYSVIGSSLAQVASSNNSYYVHSNYYRALGRDVDKVKSFFLEHRIDKFKNVIFVSNESKEGLEIVYPQLKGKFSVINNIIEYETIMKLSNEPCELGDMKQYKNFIFVGRLDNTSKNLDLMIKSIKRAVEIDKKIRLFVVGDGPYRLEMEKFISLNKFQDNIILLGEKSNPYPYLKACDCFLLTSHYEGFPVVYIECLVLNKPIISTILCSDESIDMSDYLIKVEDNEESVSRSIIEFEKNRDYKLDFEELNNKKIKKLKDIIEQK